MKKFIKWTGIIVGSLLLLAVIAISSVILRFNSKLNKIRKIEIAEIKIPTDSISIERGKHFANLCQECHGPALAGKVFFEDPKIGKIYSANLTAGEGGVGKYYKTNDWVRAIRHGVNPEGKPLLVMPAKDYQYMSEADLASVIAYLNTITPVNNPKGANDIPLLTKFIMGVGGFGDIISAEHVNHSAPFPQSPAPSDKAEYGKYLVDISGCRTCHQNDLNGGKSPDPNSPPVPNLTMAGNLKNWTADDFVKTMKTGVTPEKINMQSRYMPWPYYGQLNAEELTAVFNYLKSIPALENPK